ncbi:unnamed protein product [Acanthoscelides obtectus]|uniref:Uncharacterized protein n=1 Tax=Acanthoscelides obtectus TaxID=200917 RepID=A0A9P0JH38_ACAOB|nr:unnamed protein product [Acanthoscelides obtectus]CAK1649950.1 hypothetical protein AOBTE_LOCUS16510 [Acanthoscelides obtectus]
MCDTPDSESDVPMQEIKDVSSVSTPKKNYKVRIMRRNTKETGKKSGSGSSQVRKVQLTRGANSAVAISLLRGAKEKLKSTPPLPNI